MVTRRAVCATDDVLSSTLSRYERPANTRLQVKTNTFRVSIHPSEQTWWKYEVSRNSFCSHVPDLPELTSGLYFRSLSLLQLAFEQTALSTLLNPSRSRYSGKFGRSSRPTTALGSVKSCPLTMDEMRSIRTVSSWCLLSRQVPHHRFSARDCGR